MLWIVFMCTILYKLNLDPCIFSLCSLIHFALRLIQLYSLVYSLRPIQKCLWSSSIIIIIIIGGKIQIEMNVLSNTDIAATITTTLHMLCKKYGNWSRYAYTKCTPRNIYNVRYSLVSSEAKPLGQVWCLFTNASKQIIINIW